MSDNLDLAEAREHERRMSAAPWEADTHDTRSLETTYIAVHGSDGKSLFDTCNSEVMCIRTEHDEDGCYHVDDVGAGNLHGIAYMRNHWLALLDRLEEAERLLRLSCAIACGHEVGDKSLAFLRREQSGELADLALAIEAAMDEAWRERDEAVAELSTLRVYEAAARCGWSIAEKERDSLKAENRAYVNVLSGIHGALADAATVRLPASYTDDYAPAIRQLTSERDAAAQRAEKYHELAERAVVALHMHHHGGMNKPLFPECRKDLCGCWHDLKGNSND